MFFREGVDFLEGDRLDVLFPVAGEFEFGGVGGAAGEDGFQPVGVVAEGFVDFAEEGGAGAVEFILGGSGFGEGGGDFGGGGGEFDDVFRGADAVGDDEAEVFDGGGAIGGGLGAVGGAEFFADFLAEAVAEDVGEEVEAAELLLVAAGPGDFPEGDAVALGDFALEGEFAGDGGFRHFEGAGGLGEIFPLGPVGQGTEGLEDGGLQGGGVEIADDVQFDGGGGEGFLQPREDVIGRVGEEDIGGFGEGEAGIIATEPCGHLLHGSLGGVGQFLEGHGYGLAVLLDDFLADDGVDEPGGHELELEGEVVRGGGAGDDEGVFLDIEAGADIAAGEDALEFLGAVAADATGGDDGIGEGGEADLVGGCGEAAIADAGGEGDAVLFEIGALEIHGDAVGEGPGGDTETFDFALLIDFSCRAEIGVGELGDFDFLGCLELGSASGGEGLAEGGGDVIGGLRGGEDEAGFDGFPESGEGGLAVGRGEVLESSAGDFQIGFRGAEDAAGIDGLDRGGGEIVGFPAGGGFHGLVVGVEKVGGGFVEFGLGETEFQRAAEFVFEDGDGVFEAAIGDADIDTAEDEMLEEIGLRGGAAEDGRAGLFGEAVETEAEHGIGEIHAEVLGAGGAGVRARLIVGDGHEAEFRGGEFLVGEDEGFEAVGGGDGAEVGLGAGFGGVGEGAEGIGDAAGEIGGIDIAGDDEGHATRDVVFRVEVDEAFAWCLADDLLGADGEAAGDEGIGEQGGELFLHDPVGDGIPAGLFREDDIAFFLDFLRFEQGAIGEVAHDGEAEGEHFLAEVGEIQHVDRFIEGCVGIGVGAEGDAEALHAGDEFVRGEVFRTIEDHVFEEVGESALVLGFHEGAGGDVEADADPGGGLGVGLDDVAESVGELAEGDFRVGRDVAAFVGPGFPAAGGFGFDRGGGIRGGGLLGGAVGRDRGWRRGVLGPADHEEAGGGREEQGQDEGGRIAHGGNCCGEGAEGNGESVCSG